MRHTLPGERVVARVTEGRVGDSFVRADAVEVLEAAPGRVDRPVPVCRPGPLRWLRLPARVPRHAAGSSRRPSCGSSSRGSPASRSRSTSQPVPGRRGRAAVAHPRRVRRRRCRPCRPARHRSRDIVPVDDCLIATRAVIDSGVLDTEWPDVESVDVVDAVHPDEPVLVPLPAPEGGSAGGAASSASSPATATGRASTSSRPGASGRSTRARPRRSCPACRRCSAREPGDRVLDLYAGLGPLHDAPRRARRAGRLRPRRRG